MSFENMESDEWTNTLLWPGFPTQVAQMDESRHSICIPQKKKRKIRKCKAKAFLFLKNYLLETPEKASWNLINPVRQNIRHHLPRHVSSFILCTLWLSLHKVCGFRGRDFGSPVTEQSSLRRPFEEDWMIWSHSSWQQTSSVERPDHRSRSYRRTLPSSGGNELSKDDGVNTLGICLL